MMGRPKGLQVCSKHPDSGRRHRECIACHNERNLAWFRRKLAKKRAKPVPDLASVLAAWGSDDNLPPENRIDNPNPQSL